MDEPISRRGLLGRAAGGAALMSLGRLAFVPHSARGANDRLNIVCIGTGGRGQGHLKEIRDQGKDLNVAVVGVCDVYRNNRESAVAKAKEWFGGDIRQTTDYREALQWPDVDGVTIGTPDHAHGRILADAARAGKDAYCEKPMCNTMEEARDCLRAVQEGKRIVQIGTQRRSDGRHRAAAEFVQSGALGRISRVVMAVNFNQPRWMRSYKNVREEDVDWKRFLMHLPYRPFNPMQFACWQLCKEFTTGLPGLWMPHYIDPVHWFTGDPLPKSAVSLGGIFVWKDGREQPDTFQTLLEYPKGFLASWGMSLGNAAGNCFTLHGSNGTLDCERWRYSGDGGSGPNRIKEEKALTPLPSLGHMRAWLECVRSRQQPNAPIEAGYSHAVACIMASQAFETGRRVAYDPQTQEVSAG